MDRTAVARIALCN